MMASARAACSTAIVVLALLVATASAQECKSTRQAHVANLANVSPKGCLKQVVNATAGEVAQGLITPECFNKLNLNLTNATGADCPRTFTVSFVDQENCAAGFNEIANGTMTASTKPGTFDAVGEFVTSTPFKGTLDSKNQFMVTVKGSKCELTYALKATGKPVPVSADEAKPKEPGSAADTKAPAAESKEPAGAKPSDAKPAEPTKKSSAVASSAPVLLALLCALFAFLL